MIVLTYKEILITMPKKVYVHKRKDVINNREQKRQAKKKKIFGTIILIMHKNPRKLDTTK